MSASSGKASASYCALSDTGARAAYAALWAASPQRTVFSGLPFADATCDVFGLTGRIALGEGDEVGAVLFEKRTGPVLQAVVPPLTPYTGPVLREPVGPAVADRLGAFLQAVTARYGAVAFHPPPGVEDVRPFTWAGFQAAPRYTFWGPVDLVTSAPYVRMMVRKTGPVRADGSVRESGITTRRDDTAAADVGRFTVRALERGGGTELRETHVETLVRALVAAGQAQVFVAETATGARIGAVATALDDQTAHSWTGASDPGPAQSLMTAAVAAGLEESGHRTFDLSGANVARIAAFKQRFGLPLAVHYRVEWTGSRLLRLRNALR